jgi:hypothetical protein
MLSMVIIASENSGRLIPFLTFSQPVGLAFIALNVASTYCPVETPDAYTNENSRSWRRLRLPFMGCNTWRFN